MMQQNYYTYLYTKIKYMIHIVLICSQYRNSLLAGRSGDRSPLGARFAAPIQTDPGAHPASYTMGTSSFLGVKWPGHGIHHTSPSSTKVKERVELYLYSPSRPSWPVIV
jgi:hypothetical protein